LPAVPAEAVSLLSDFIEFSYVGEADLIFELLSDIQLQSAGLRGLISDIGRDDMMITKDNIDDYLIDTATIYARASAGFDFFRHRSDTLPTGISWEQVKSAARQLDLCETTYSDLCARIDPVRSAIGRPGAWTRF
jgi:hypothetical protein